MLILRILSVHRTRHKIPCLRIPLTELLLPILNPVLYIEVPDLALSMLKEGFLLFPTSFSIPPTFLLFQRVVEDPGKDVSISLKQAKNHRRYIGDLSTASDREAACTRRTDLHLRSDFHKTGILQPHRYQVKISRTSRSITALSLSRRCNHFHGVSKICVG